MVHSGGQAVQGFLLPHGQIQTQTGIQAGSQGTGACKYTDKDWVTSPVTKLDYEYMMSLIGINM